MNASCAQDLCGMITDRFEEGGRRRAGVLKRGFLGGCLSPQEPPDPTSGFYLGLHTLKLPGPYSIVIVNAELLPPS